MKQRTTDAPKWLEFQTPARRAVPNTSHSRAPRMSPIALNPFKSLERRNKYDRIRLETTSKAFEISSPCTENERHALNRSLTLRECNPTHRDIIAAMVSMCAVVAADPMPSELLPDLAE